MQDNLQTFAFSATMSKDFQANLKKKWRLKLALNAINEKNGTLGVF